MMQSMALTALIRDLDSMIGGGAAGLERAVAERLAISLLAPDLFQAAPIEFQDCDYRVNVLHTDPAGRWGLAAIAWLPGQQSSIHDHRAWCAFGVHQGAAVEEYFSTVHGCAQVCGQRALTSGATGFAGAVGAGRQAAIHRIANRCDRPLISLHAYGCDLANGGSSVSTKFDA